MYNCIYGNSSNITLTESLCLTSHCPKNFVTNPTAYTVRTNPTAYTVRTNPTAYTVRTNPTAYTVRTNPTAYTVRTNPTAYTVRTNWHSVHFHMYILHIYNFD